MEITVFTPTYNRAFCLGRLYQSLASQTRKDFLWLIIDDGSADNTKQLVDSWISEDKIRIKYLYKQNGGMHTAHNAAYREIDTELNVCIDSDDQMPADAIEKILKKWRQVKHEKVAGIVGLDADLNGNIIGTKIPENVKFSTMTDLYSKYHVTGDKKLVLRTSVVREFPAYPEFKGERLVPLGTLYRMIDSKYQLACTNDVYCIVEYLAEGSSNNIMRQYRKSPNGFLYSRLVELKYSSGFKYKFTRAMHLVSSGIFAKRGIFKDNPAPVITLLASPFGVLLNLYIRWKAR